MYLHIGNRKMLRLGSIIGIFDLDRTSVSPSTKKFIQIREGKGMTEMVSSDIPRSLILTEDDKLYFSQITSKTIQKCVEASKGD